MNSAVVNRELRAVVRPSLQTNGFTAFTARTAWRYQPGRIEIVNFQSFNDYFATVVGCTTYSFSLNLGVYLTGLPESRSPVKVKNGELRPEAWHGHLRATPERRLDQPELLRRDIWYIDPPGHYLVAAVRGARAVLLEVGLVWFDRWSTDTAILDALGGERGTLEDGTELPGALGSPVRNLVTGYVAHRAGAVLLARQHLARALQQFEASDEANARLRLRRPMPPSVPAGLRELVARLQVTA